MWSQSVATRLAAQNALFQESWETSLKLSPTQATAVGDYRYNDQLADYSLAAVTRRHEINAAYLKRIQAIDPAGFAEEDRTSHDLFLRNLQEGMDDYDLKNYEMPISMLGGPHTSLADLPLSMPFDSVKHYEDYIARLHKIPTALTQTEDVLRVGVRDHLTMVKFLAAKIADAVDVRFTPSANEPRRKFFGFLFTAGMLIVFVCALLFLPGKHGQPSMWHGLTSEPSTSFDVVLSLILLPFVGLFGWHEVRYARAAWASDETFQCDRKAITISRVPWLNFSNRAWRTYTYPLTEVSKIRFAVIASEKTSSFWGLRFRAHGRKWVLPGLEAPEAKTILAGLKALGADVPDDPKLDKRIQQTLEMRFGDTSWMDRSWMDANSNTDHKN